ncbi:conserved unknown protein [Nannochloropsis gaditana]|uniref:SWIM-type domain-containing protein n=1 Tax=Nannochloropsis gaditana TaxID=72520 RepID=W7TK44_9STRA|nr:conserved unknown protein [Nannochloropsis gaditana]
MDPILFLSRVLELQECPSSCSVSPFPSGERGNCTGQQDPQLVDEKHSTGSNEIAQSAVLKLASELLYHEPGFLEGAVEALDRAPVRRIITRQYRRCLHLVKGRDRAEYTVLSGRDCSCQSFHIMQQRSLRPRCKHVLAVHLAPFLGRLEERVVNDDLYEAYVTQ